MPERLGSYLGYGDNPYEVRATRDLVEGLTRGLGEVVQALYNDPKTKFRELIDETVVSTGCPRELVIIFAATTAMMACATTFATNPPSDRVFDLNRDTLRRFRAHLWDAVDVGNRLQRKILDEWRGQEIERRRS